MQKWDFIFRWKYSFVLTSPFLNILIITSHIIFIKIGLDILYIFFMSMSTKSLEVLRLQFSVYINGQSPEVDFLMLNGLQRWTYQGQNLIFLSVHKALGTYFFIFAISILILDISRLGIWFPNSICWRPIMV